MTVQYDPAARRGEQYTIHRDGQTVARVSRADAEAMLQSEGASIREAAIAIAQAKLAASNM
jgi:antitoxin (DNA-binding transcriptional repressor) of toxin-antitoxin stability system